MVRFRFGEFLPPEVEKGSYGRLGRPMFCITPEMLLNIVFGRLKARRLKWSDYCGRRWQATKRTRHDDVIINVILCDCGWWRVRLFDKYKNDRQDLCLAFTSSAAIFPHAQSAMKAAEIFSSGQYWEVARLVWMDQADDWRFFKHPSVLLPTAALQRTATI
jgi:hypothetical protein